MTSSTSILATIVAIGVSAKSPLFPKSLPVNTQDGAYEKHIPVYQVENNIVKVRVGEVDHPMLEAHYIQWIALQTDKGNQRKVLEPGQAPYAEFALLPGEKVVAVYEYCNLHGLYKA